MWLQRALLSCPKYNLRPTSYTAGAYVYYRCVRINFSGKIEDGILYLFLWVSKRKRQISHEWDPPVSCVMCHWVPAVVVVDRVQRKQDHTCMLHYVSYLHLFFFSCQEQQRTAFTQISLAKNFGNSAASSNLWKFRLTYSDASKSSLQKIIKYFF